MKAERLRVVYSVTFECDVLVEDGEDEQDAISNIDIPEGGRNGSVYCEDSFEILEIHNREEIARKMKPSDLNGLPFRVEEDS